MLISNRSCSSNNKSRMSMGGGVQCAYWVVELELLLEIAPALGAAGKELEIIW